MRLLIESAAVIIAALVAASIADAAPGRLGPTERLCDRAASAVVEYTQSLADPLPEGEAALCRAIVATAPSHTFTHPEVALAVGLAWAHQQSRVREQVIAVQRSRNSFSVVRIGEGTQYEVRVDVPEGAIAIAHTHVRVDGLRECSRIDDSTADRLPILVYVQHHRGEIARCGSD